MHKGVPDTAVKHGYGSGNNLRPSGRDGGFGFSPFCVKIDGATGRLEVDQLFILPIISGCAVQQYHNMLFAYMERYRSGPRIQALYQFQYSFNEFKRRNPTLTD